MTLKQEVITVFGGSGFIGRHLIRELANTGATVRVATRNPAWAFFLRPCGSVGQVVPVACDITKDDSVATVLQGATQAVNLVGILAQGGGNSFKAIHAEAPARIARLAKKAGVKKLVHVSALGASPDSESKYQRSKADGEKAVRSAFKKATIMRPSVIFGPEDNFFNMFATMARYSPWLPLIGGGKTKFQPVYVCDVANAIARALASDSHAGKTYELGGPYTYSFRQLLTKTLDYSGQEAALVPVPWPAAHIQGLFLGMLPKKLLTVDQVKSLKTDNVVTGKEPTLEDMGITPTPLEAIVPTYLSSYRPGGRFARREIA